MLAQIGTERPSRASLGLGALLLLGVVMSAGACAKRITNVDAGRFPEGTPSSSRLVIYADVPNFMRLYRDVGEPGFSGDDVLVESTGVYTTGPGAVQGMIIDLTPASRFEVFRMEGSGGFAPLKDFLLVPDKLLLDMQVDLVTFNDPHPPGSPRTYVARGLVEGTANAASPLTNVARLTRTTVDGNLALRFRDWSGLIIPPSSTRRPDSTFNMEWDPVPGAVAYWVHVYQLTAQSGSEIIRSGIPTPIYVGDSRDLFIGLLPASRTSFRIDAAIPSDVRVLMNRKILNGQSYTVRVSAVDADGQLIATTGVSGTQEVFRSESTFVRFPLGGYRWITEGRPVIGPTIGSAH
jgi:hypothetical protein